MALYIARPSDVERALPRGTRDPVALPEYASHRTTAHPSGYPWEWLVNTVGESQAWPTRPMANAVTEATVTGIPAAWKCFTFIANAGASCAPPIEFDGNGDRVETLSNIVERPWAMLSIHEFWTQAFSSALLFGQFLGARIDYDPVSGFPRQVMPWHPNDVLMMLIDGFPVYGWGGEAFGWDEVVHVRGHTSPGSLWGIGVIEAFRRALGEALALEDYGGSLYRSAAENSVIIQVDRPELTQEQADAIQERWIARHASGVRRPAVLPRSMTVTPLSFSPADAQFLESRQFTVAEIAFMFSMDPSDLSAAIGSGSGTLTYANREQREIERLTHAVGPWMRRFEQTWADLLPGRRSIAFNSENLLRTDTSTRLNASAAALAAGILTLNDARNVERLPVYGAWANEPFRTRDDVPTPEPTPEPAAQVR